MAATSKPAFSFSSKAMTLKRLAGRVTKGKLCDQIIVEAPSWSNGREAVLDKIIERFSALPLVVRSSAAAEDNWDNSLAGAHLSIANVTSSKDPIATAIDDVFASYHENSPNDEVLVQPMVDGVVISGVVLTHDLDTGGPYFVINYDDFTGRTDTVTGGSESKTILVHRARPDVLKSPRLRKLIDCVIELESVTGTSELDVEFCITETEDVYILQVRPLAAQQQWAPLPKKAVDTAINDIRETITDIMRPETGLAGHTTMLAEMTDWNPAEMIGTTPRPLALSLYKTLITDRIYAEARACMGYQLVNEPLLIDFYGRPYIDVRRSLNSFLPANIDDDFARRWIDFQLDRLTDNPDFHDKVEFEIAVTCLDFSFARVRENLVKAGFNGPEIENLHDALGNLTRNIIEPGQADIANLVGQSNRLLEERPEVASLPPLKRMRRLLDDCRALGTLPFSQLARHGFIGVLFLKSLVQRGVFSQEGMDNFMHGIHTVATDLVHDMRAVTTGAQPEPDFFARYGHLRPGTYDILSWRYDERPDLFLGHTGRDPAIEETSFKLATGQKSDIEDLLKENGFSLSADGLLAYITDAIRAREQSKFAFTRAISDALSALAEWGGEVGFSRDDLSFLPIHAIGNGKGTEELTSLMEEGREGFKLTRAIRLPHLIMEPADIDIIRMPLGQPTFITGMSVTAPTKHLFAENVLGIDGHIVLIESADPGFDWIFSHDIQGLITMFGGANSHMAIRCAEFGLPAAIGCGERLFETLTKASLIELNCAARKVTGH